MQLGVIKNGNPLSTVQFLEVKPGHDMPDLLLQAAKALAMRSALKFYTQQGGEIEELREILPGDILYVSAGEKFLNPPREAEYLVHEPADKKNAHGFPFKPPAADAIKAPSPSKADVTTKKNKKEEYQKVVMSLSETFPDEPMNMLAAATILAEGNIERAAVLLLERPYSKELLKQKQALDNKVAPSDLHVKEPSVTSSSPPAPVKLVPSPAASVAVSQPVISAVGALPFAMPFAGEAPKAKPSATPAPVASPSLLSSALGPLPSSSAPAVPAFEYAAQLQTLKDKFPSLSADDYRLKQAMQMLINYKGDVALVSQHFSDLGVAKPPASAPVVSVAPDSSVAVPANLPAPLIPEVAQPKMTVKISLTPTAQPDKRP